MSRFQRRQFLFATCALLAAPAAPAQLARRSVRIAVLDEADGDLNSEIWYGFRSQLQKLGHIEGRGLLIDVRSVRGVSEHLHPLAKELVALKPDLIVTTGTPSTLAAMKAITIIPIVFTGAGDPIKTGIVTSLARPEGNVTGQSIMTVEIVAKWLEMFLEIVPNAKKIAYLGPVNSPIVKENYRSLQEIGPSRGLTISLLDTSTPNAIARTFESMARERFSGFLIGATSLLIEHRKSIVDLVARYRLPAVYGREEYVAAGGLLSYGRDIVAGYRRAADFAHRILQGAKPADLPVEQSSAFRTVVNLATARELGIKIPQSILLRADHVIE